LSPGWSNRGEGGEKKKQKRRTESSPSTQSKAIEWGGMAPRPPEGPARGKELERKGKKKATGEGITNQQYPFRHRLAEEKKGGAGGKGKIRYYPFLWPSRRGEERKKERDEVGIRPRRS